MLSVAIQYKTSDKLAQTFSTLQMEFHDNKCSLPLPSKVRKLIINHKREEHKLFLEFPDHVTFKDCQFIYEFIHSLVLQLDGQVEDSKALLGYDENGEKVFIYNRFSHWSEYINEAKHKSLEGQKVAIHHGEEVLGEGMLLTYKKVTEPDSGSIFITCEILTKEGEQSFFGENLEVIPVTQW